MPTTALDRHLTAFEQSRYLFSSTGATRVVKLLKTLDAARFPDARSLIRFHEALMFLRAFPQSPRVIRQTERLLGRFHLKVKALRKAGAKMDDFDPLEVSGISGTTMEDTLSFDVARWLVRRMPGQVEIAWDNYDPGRELGTTGPRFMPLLEDDSYVEADTPWRRWLEAAAGENIGKKDGTKKNETRNKKAPAGNSATAAWLIQSVADLPLPAIQKCELYESLQIPLRWSLGNSRLSRTRKWNPVRKVFYHDAPLIPRSQVLLTDELSKRPPKLVKLSRREGEAVIDMIREVMLVRYRELYGTTLGDPASVVRADLGGDNASRGTDIYLWNLPPARRLPLRAYVAGLTLKNGVPINYIEAIGLCEWMEVGFNTFYTFRGGEAGWIYAQVLRSLCHLMGTTCVSVYPYQLGHDNKEAIQSGAFWFYRKLGFRPGRPDLERLVEREENKIAADPAYRTPARTLKRLAAGHVFHELPGSEPRAWDTFSTRNIGLRVNRHLARHFDGDSQRMRKEAVLSVSRTLKIDPSTWPSLDRSNFENFALVLSQVPDLALWTRAAKQAAIEVIRAKSHPDEMRYLHLTQQHDRLRQALLKLGS